MGILHGKEDKSKTVYLRRQPNPRKKILVTEALEPPNPKCYVCADKPEVHIKLNMETMTVRSFEERILKGALNMVAPDAEIDGKGVIILSSEEGETEENMDKPLSAFGLADGGVLSCDDFLQNYTLRVYLWQMTEKTEDGSDFIVTGDKDKLQPKEAEEEKKEVAKDTNGDNKDEAIDVQDDDIMEVVPHANGAGDNKRKGGDEGSEPSAKKTRVDGDDIVICETPSADDLKKGKKAAEPSSEEGVVCID